MKSPRVLLLGALVLGTGVIQAQVPPLKFPDASPSASVSQTVGLTDVTITYHRPAVNKRKIWGELVPYNEVWRAGANENTTISFSTPVTVGGKTLPAGTYGLHTLPGESAWSVMLSSVSSAWGSRSIDQGQTWKRLSGHGLARRSQSRASAWRSRRAQPIDHVCRHGFHRRRPVALRRLRRSLEPGQQGRRSQRQAILLLAHRSGPEKSGPYFRAVQQPDGVEGRREELLDHRQTDTRRPSRHLD